MCAILGDSDARRGKQLSATNRNTRWKRFVCSLAKLSALLCLNGLIFTFSFHQFSQPSQPPPLSSDIVVAHCSKDLDWIPSFLDEITPGSILRRLYVYSSCNQVELAKFWVQSLDDQLLGEVFVISRPNTGGNDGAFAQHLSTYYNNMSDVTWFLKDSGFNYPIDFLRLLRKSPSKVLEELRLGEDFVCFRKPDFTFSTDASVWHVRERVWDFRLSSYVTADHFDSQRPENDYVTSRQSFCSFLRSHLSLQEFVELRSRDVIQVCYGGEFAVTRSSVHFVSQETWADLAATLNAHRTAEHLHFMERTWAAILSRKPPPEKKFLNSMEVVDFFDANGVSYPGLLYTTGQSGKHLNRRPGKRLACEREGGRIQVDQSVFVVLVHTLELEGSILYLLPLIHLISAKMGFGVWGWLRS